MPVRKIGALLFCLIAVRGWATQVGGVVLDADTGLAVSGALVSIAGNVASSTAVTDSDGIFILSLPNSAGATEPVRIRVQKDRYTVSDRQVAPQSLPIVVRLVPTDRRKRPAKTPPPLILKGRVVTAQKTAVPRGTEVRIVGGPKTLTEETSGEFKLAISAPDVTSADIRVGHPVTFSVTDWVIVDPYYGERGRTYLPAPDVEPIKIVVSKPGDPSLISSDSITQILSQRTFTLPPDEPLRETLRSPRIQYARFVIRETHAGGQDDDWSAFLDARAGEIGFDPLTLRSKIDAWGHRGPTEYWTRYMRGLYAIYEGRNSDAVRWFAGGLNGTLGARDDEYFMALAYALLRRGDYEGAARFVSLAMEQQPSDPTYKVDRRMIQLMPHPRPTVKTDEERFRICRDVMSNVLSGDIRSVRDHFSSVLRFKISEDSLNKIIGDAIGSAGQFRRESSEYVSEVDNTWLYLTRWQFEFATVELRLYFDGSNNITEIWLTPQSADRTKKLEEQTKRILDLLKDLPKARAELRSQLDANLSEGFDEDQWSWLAPFSPSAPLADADSLVVEVPYYSSHATKLSLVLTFDPDFKLRNLTVTATK